MMKHFINKFFLMTAVLIMLMASTVSAETYGQTVWTSDEVDSSEFAKEVVRLVNIERANVGVQPLEFSEELTERADVRAEEIVGVFSHTRPDGSDCFSILRGINYRTCGENIAAGKSTPEAVVDQWMNSSGHRANILNGNFKYLGVGYCYDENSMYKHYWVQLFIG